MSQCIAKHVLEIQMNPILNAFILSIRRAELNIQVYHTQRPYAKSYSQMSLVRPDQHYCPKANCKRFRWHSKLPMPEDIRPNMQALRSRCFWPADFLVDHEAKRSCLIKVKREIKIESKHGFWHICDFTDSSLVHISASFNEISNQTIIAVSDSQM